MRELCCIFMIAGCSLSASADRSQAYGRIVEAMDLDESLADHGLLDTVVLYDGYHVRIVNDRNNMEFAGLDLFPDDAEKIVDRNTLDYIESSLLSRVMGSGTMDNARIGFVSGDISDFRDVTPLTQCDIRNVDSRFLSFEWILDDDRVIRLEMSLDYFSMSGKSRGEIERSFIDRVRHNDRSLYGNAMFPLSTDRLMAYGDDLFVLPGRIYRQNEINSNVYFTGGSDPLPVYNEEYPVESMANLFIYPFDNIGEVDLELTVLKHEYGDKEMFSSPLRAFMAVCEDEGCQPFWGLESYDGSILRGSLFLCNRRSGYVHVVSIECVPRDVIEGNGAIKGRASLYIPDNNIESLYETND